MFPRNAFHKYKKPHNISNRLTKHFGNFEGAGRMDEMNSNTLVTSRAQGGRATQGSDTLVTSRAQMYVPKNCYPQSKIGKLIQ